MTYDVNGNEVIKYEILEVLSCEDLISDFKDIESDENEHLLKVICKVETEYGDILDHVSYWIKEDWVVAPNKGFYFMTDAALVLD